MTTDFDRWLEAPYVDAARREAEYEAWCEDQDLDMDEDHWEEFENAQVEAQEQAVDDAEWRRGCG